MYHRPLLPDGIRPPDSFEGTGFVARPLRVTDAEDDFAAVMAARHRLKGAMDPDDPWPDGLTLHQNIVDLGWHEREFTLGHSFAWTVTAPKRIPTLGCCYLYPSDRAGFDAMAFWWVRPEADGIAPALDRAFRAVVAALPLRTAFPGRDLPMADWRAPPP
ncbi:MAG: hypothetical protein N2422_12205, partial [Rhodobacteraceae bacterium]|nr:hypothetical protein [Paracoccaceae bacterium]